MNMVPFDHGDTSVENAKANALAEISQTEGARRRLYDLQLFACDLPQIECPLQHLFAPGVYVRTIFIPAGSVIVGKIHKHRHANILSQGKVTVYTESGGTEELEGPLQMISEPGTKRAVLAHTDAIWTTIHPNVEDETDLEKIEDFVIAKTYAEYEQFRLKYIEVPS